MLVCVCIIHDIWIQTHSRCIRRCRNIEIYHTNECDYWPEIVIYVWICIYIHHCCCVLYPKYQCVLLRIEMFNGVLCLAIQSNAKNTPRDKIYFIQHYERCLSHLRVHNVSQCVMAMHTVDSLWPSDAIWLQRSELTLAQVMACCLTAPSHYLNQSWLISKGVLCHSLTSNCGRRAQELNPLHMFGEYTLRLATTRPRGQWVQPNMSLWESTLTYI